MTTKFKMYANLDGGLELCELLPAVDEFLTDIPAEETAKLLAVRHSLVAASFGSLLPRHYYLCISASVSLSLCVCLSVSLRLSLCLSVLCLRYYLYISASVSLSLKTLGTVSLGCVVVQVAIPIVRAKEAAAKAAAEQAAAKIAAAEAAPKQHWSSQDVTTLTKAIFAAADRGKNDGELSANELQSYLPGSPYKDFGEWVLRPRPPLGRAYYKDYGGFDGQVSEEELEPAVQRYLTVMSVKPNMILQ